MEKQKEYHDSAAKKHLPLKEGSTVRVNKGCSWPVKGRMIEQDKHPRSYKIQSEEDRVMKRNRRDLLQTKEPLIRGNADIDEPLGEYRNTEKEIQKEQNDNSTTKSNYGKQ